MSSRTIPQHCLKTEPFKAVLQIVNDYSGVTITPEIKDDILQQLEICGLYKPRKNGKYGLGTAGHKIDEPHFYGGLYISSGKIHISNYGILLLDNRDNEINRAKIFCSMLFSVQFPNLAKAKMDPNIQLYPFRILFRYLIDYGKIDIVSFSRFFYELKTMKSEKEYKNLVNKIQIFLGKDIDEQKQYISYDVDNFIKNYVSCKYCFSLLNNFGILEIKENQHSLRGKIKSKKRKAPTNILNISVSLNENIKGYVEVMLNKYSIYDPIKTGDLKSELSRKILNYVAPESLDFVDNSKPSYSLIKWMSLPENLITSAIDSNRWSEFEENITKGFNIFSDITAERIGGPSEPDVLCEYTEYGEHFGEIKHIFTADAKSTNKKLISINAGRLNSHKQKYGGEFSIVITPHWVPSAEIDIYGSKICLLSSYAFSDIVKLGLIKQLKEEEFSFYPIYDVIRENLGCDISNEVYKVIDEISGINSKILG